MARWRFSQAQSTTAALGSLTLGGAVAVAQQTPLQGAPAITQDGVVYALARDVVWQVQGDGSILIEDAQGQETLVPNDQYVATPQGMYLAEDYFVVTSTSVSPLGSFVGLQSWAPIVGGGVLIGAIDNRNDNALSSGGIAASSNLAPTTTLEKNCFIPGTAESVDLASYFTDPEIDSLSLTVSDKGLPSSVTIAGSTLSYDGSGSYGDHLSALSVTANDGNGNTTSVDVDIGLARTETFTSVFGNPFDGSVVGTICDDDLSFGSYAGRDGRSVNVTVGEGDDIVSFGNRAAQRGAISVEGGGGSDRIEIDGNAARSGGMVNVDGGAGDDTILLKANAGRDNGEVDVSGGSGNDSITFGKNAGRDSGNINADGGGGDDSIVFGTGTGSNNGNVNAIGGEGADTLTFGKWVGGSGGNVIIDLSASDKAQDSVVFLGVVYAASITGYVVGEDAKIDMTAAATSTISGTLSFDGNDTTFGGGNYKVTLMGGDYSGFAVTDIFDF